MSYPTLYLTPPPFHPIVSPVCSSLYVVHLLNLQYVYLAQYKLLPRELTTVLGVIAKVILLPSGLLVLRIISSRRQPARGERLC